VPNSFRDDEAEGLSAWCQNRPVTGLLRPWSSRKEPVQATAVGSGWCSGTPLALQKRVTYNRPCGAMDAQQARMVSMSINSNYLFVVNMDVDVDKEALFNEIYDTEHIPNLLKVPGVRGVTRMAGEPFAMSIGGAEKKVAHDGPRYSAIYEIDGPHVLVSQEWANAVEEGRWPSQIRPFTHNRRHALYKVR
jgi:hypothetical protein